MGLAWKAKAKRKERELMWWRRKKGWIRIVWENLLSSGGIAPLGLRLPLPWTSFIILMALSILSFMASSYSYLYPHPHLFNFFFFHYLFSCFSMASFTYIYISFFSFFFLSSFWFICICRRHVVSRPSMFTARKWSFRDALKKLFKASLSNDSFVRRCFDLFSLIMLRI